MTNEQTHSEIASIAARLLKMSFRSFVMAVLTGKMKWADVKSVAASALTQAPNRKL